MNKLLLLACLLVTGCSTARPVTTLQALPPQPIEEKSHKSTYRKTIEILVVGCGPDGSVQQFSKKRKPGQITVVESTATGERFYVHGCMGREGDRFKIAY